VQNPAETNKDEKTPGIFLLFGWGSPITTVKTQHSLDKRKNYPGDNSIIK